MGDDITIGVTEIVNNIEVTAQPNDQIVDISVIDNADDVTLNITPTVIEINVNRGSSFAKWGTILGTLSDQTDLQNALDLKANLVGGKVPASELPSYVDDVVEVANYAALPTTGETGKIYVTLDNNKIYRWSGSIYIEIASNSAIWGAITGTLSSQTDLVNALNLRVPYTGATSNVNLGEYGLTSGFLALDTTPTSTPTGIGTIYWDATNRTASLIDGDGDTTLQIGQEERILVHNNTGATLTDGQVVYVTGSTGNLPSVALANASSETTSAATLGVVTESIANGADGFVTISGIVNGLNTLAFNEGDLLWLGTTAGTFTATKPISPSHLVLIGYVIKKAGGNGSILVKVQNTQELKESSDVLFTSLTNKDFLVYESATDLWKNKSLGTVLAGTSFQFVKGDGSLDSTAYVPTARTLTINGTAYDLTADRSWTIATHNPVGIGTSNGLSIDSNQQLSLALASTSTNGALSSTDWNTFNGKQNALTNPVTGTGTSGQVAFWNGTSSITGESNLFWDSTNDRLGIGIASPDSRLMVSQNTTGESQIHINNSTTGAGSSRLKLSNNSDTDLRGFQIINNASNGVVNLLNYKNTDLALWTNFAERMRITSGGNVGIGTTSPAEKLSVVGGNISLGAGYKLQYSSTAYMTPENNVSGAEIATGGILTIKTGGTTERVRVDASGNVGIGTTSPSAKLEVVGGGIRFGNGTIIGELGYSSRAEIGTISNHNLGFTTNSITQMLITSGGNVGIGTTSPSQKLVVDGGTADFMPIFAKSSLLSGGKYFGSLLAGYQTDVSKSAQFGYVYDSSNIANSYAHITTFGASEGSQFAMKPNGNVGIGTTSPGGKLHVVGEGIFDDGTNGRLTFANASSQNDIYSTTTSFGGWKNLRLSSNELILSSGGNTERMRITSGGNVGIGTSSPLRKLTVTGSSGTTMIALENIGIDYYGIGMPSGSADMAFYSSASTERMRITSGGDLLVGKTGGWTENGLQTEVGATTVGITNNSGANNLFLRKNGVAGNVIAFYYDGTSVGSIAITSSTTGYYTSSDYRLKTDLKSFNGLDLVSQIKVYDYEWKIDNTRSFGVMAHELQEILPQAVTGEKDAEQMQSVDYSKIVPILVQSIQELKAEIELLKSKL